MRNAHKYVCFLSIVVLLACAQTVSAIDINIAGETIRIPAPTGFTEVSSFSEGTFAMFEDMSPAQNRLLAVFVSQQDAGQLMHGDSGDLQEYMTVHSFTNLESMTIAKYHFSEFRHIFRKEYDSLFQNQEESIGQAVNKVRQALSRRLSTDVDFNVNGIAPLGIDEETASLITMSQLVKFEMSATGENVEYVAAETMTVLLVKGKILLVSVFKTCAAERDLSWTRSQSREWLPAILAANGTTWPLPLGEIVPEGTPVDLVTKQLLSDEQAEYNLKSHPKAHGLDISIKYPKSWRAEEGIRPHIVQKFTGETVGRIFPLCMLTVQKLPAGASLFFDGDMGKEVLKESLRVMVPPNATYIDSGQTKIDGEPGAWLKYYYQGELAGVGVGMYSLQYVLFYEGKILALNCSVVSALVNDKELLEDAFASYLPVFQMIGNSVVINDKWDTNVRGRETSGTPGLDPEVLKSIERTEQQLGHPLGSPRYGRQPEITNVHSEEISGTVVPLLHRENSGVILIFSAILTWGIGLAPPLLVRFGFMRKPMSEKGAIAFVVIFFFVNLAIVIALGSQSKTHSAILFVAMASYYILRRGAKKEKVSDPPAPLAQQERSNRAPNPI